MICDAFGCNRLRLDCLPIFADITHQFGLLVRSEVVRGEFRDATDSVLQVAPRAEVVGCEHADHELRFVMIPQYISALLYLTEWDPPASYHRPIPFAAQRSANA